MQSSEPLSIFNSIAFFKTEKEAINYIIKKGKQITEDLENIYEEGCALCIIKQENKDDLEDYLNIVDIYWCNKTYPTFVFSKLSYHLYVGGNE